MMKRMGYALIGSCLFAGALFGAHGMTGVHAAPAHKTKAVSINGTGGQYSFSPKKATVTVGTKVVWTNHSDAPHTVTGTGSWKFNSKTFNANGHVSFVFKKAGTYHYFCSIHPFMKGMVVVHK